MAYEDDPYYYYDNPEPKDPEIPEEDPGTPTPSEPAPESGGTEAPDPWATAPTDGNWQNWFLTNVQGTAATPEALAALEAKLTPHGIKVLRNAEGIAGKLQLPNGQIIDVGRAFSSGDPSQMAWVWQIGGNEYTAPDGTAVEIDPTYLAPFDEQFVLPDDAKPLGEFDFPEFTYEAFSAPDAQAVLDDPGYQFRLDTGRRMLETSAAAKGLLNSGGTLQDLIDYGQSLGSQEYGNVFNRRMDTWRANRGNAFDNFGVNRDTAMSEWGLNKSLRDTNYQRSWDQFLERRNTFYQNQNNPFNKIITAAQVGAGAAAS